MVLYRTGFACLICCEGASRENGQYQQCQTAPDGAPVHCTAIIVTVG